MLKVIFEKTVAIEINTAREKKKIKKEISSLYINLFITKYSMSR